MTKRDYYEVLDVHEQVPFTGLVPWERFPFGDANFYQVPGHDQYLIREIGRGNNIDLEIPKQTEIRAALSELVTYGVKNSGRFTVIDKNTLYNVSHLIDGENLLKQVHSGDKLAVKEADRINGALLNYFTDLYTKGGLLAFDVYDFRQYVMSTRGEAILVDVDSGALHIGGETQENPTYHLLGYCFLQLAENCANLAKASEETSTPDRFLAISKNLAVRHPVEKKAIQVARQSVANKSPELIAQFENSDRWSDYLDWGPEND